MSTSSTNNRSRKDRPSLSLMQKLTMLVAFPLVFEFLFVGSLTVLLVTAQNDALRLEVAKDKEAVSNNILHNMYQLISTGFLCSMKKDSVSIHIYESAKQALPQQLATLRQISATDAEAQRSAQIVTVLANRLVDDLDALTALSKASFSRYLETASDVGHHTRSLMRECANIAAIQRRIHPHPTTQTDWQTIIYGVIAAGILLSVGVSGGALRYVHLDLLDRISKITRNTEAIARREPLPENVPGSDELANLDRFVHETDQSLRRLEQMRQEFFAMLTHDMRSPLTQIQFSVSLIADGAYKDQPEKQQTMMKTLVPEIARLNRLIEDLLSANKLESEPLKLAKEAVAGSALLNQVRESMEVEATSRERKLLVNADDTQVMADSFQLARVLTNLCANALRYSPQGGTVELRCSTIGDRAIFEVIDDGPGISPEAGAQLFQRYRQGDDDQTRGGYGLGLFIAKSIIDAHGGEIGFRNRTGDNEHGCIFFFSLACPTD